MEYGQIAFNDGVSSLANMLSFFHDSVIILIIFVFSIVLWFSLLTSYNRTISRYGTSHEALEIFWTILPAITLVFLATPSLRLLYVLDDPSEVSVTIKATGHQWYWSYSYPDFMNLSFDSYMTPLSELNSGEFRLLEVDNRIITPADTPLRILTTSDDVIHSWTIPALGANLDAIPGRLNQTTFTVLEPGITYGQCSEICGINHSFIPIVIEAIPAQNFLSWLSVLSPS